ncbi:MAG: hypothetical protein JRE28_10395 [Deltaproteobacteria bacterium]|nr:hypothetical protein [Deltaproteobacteria bacterium]
MAFQYKELEDMEHIPAPAGIAAPKTQHATEDGKTLVYGTTVPTDAATGYAPGCEFIDVDNGARYLNEGTSASADFNQESTTANVVAAIEGSQLSGTAAGVGPSPLIWDNAKLLEVMLDPTAGFYYFNDYMGEIDTATGSGFTLTQSNSTGTISGLATDQGGALVVTSAGSTADDSLNVQLTNCLVKPAAGVTIRFEARLNMLDATQQYYVGLAGVVTALLASGAIDDTVDKAGFFHHAASTDNKISSICSRADEDDATADVAANADGTYVKLGMVIDGVTSVKFYVNGVLVETGETALAIPNAVMCLSLFAGYEGAAGVMHVDWVRILQEGGRAT